VKCAPNPSAPKSRTNQVGKASHAARIAFSIAAAAALSGCAARMVPMPGIGQVPWDEVCPDASCGTEGEDVRVVNDKTGRGLVASDPSKFLGAKMNPDALGAAPQVCGHQVSSSQWSQAATAHHSVNLSAEQGAKFKARVSAAIGSELKLIASASPDGPKPAISAKIDRILGEAVSVNQTFEAATYTLAGGAYKAQLAACGGQTAGARVVRSLSVLRVSIDSSAHIRDALESRISADAELKAAMLSPSNPTVRSLVDKVVGMKVAEFTFVLAVGFDKG
jgi:hypothetical protein